MATDLLLIRFPDLLIQIADWFDWGQCYLPWPAAFALVQNQVG